MSELESVRLKDLADLAFGEAEPHCQRPMVAAGLRAMGLQVVEGRANYLLFRAPEWLGEALRQKGVVVRSCANYPGLDAGWYRTAVRTPEENAQLLETLREVLK